MKDREAVRKLPDNDIISEINRGNTYAFRFLVERYEDQVAKIVIGMLGYGSGVEDIGQEIFIRVYKSLKNFRFRSTFRTYLVRIAINVCLDEIKNRKKKPAFSSEQEAMTKSLPSNSDADYEIRDGVCRALQELDDAQRIVVILRMMEGYTTRETASLLKIPEGTVLSRLARAQKKLQELLNYLIE